MVYADEDGAAELDGVGGVIPGVDGGGAAADVGISLEDGYAGVDGGVAGELRKVVGCG